VQPANLVGYIPQVSLSQAVTYDSIVNELEKRIESLVPNNPQILEMKDPWGLFGIEGFICGDLQPSYHQACWALSRVQGNHKKKE
jgi:hypothetical protein